uniref:Uncharacterized protein n=1 Tax=Anguilla anguilla TaxID=7936 RepID=A0A0E9QDB5_ANGAN
MYVTVKISTVALTKQWTHLISNFFSLLFDFIVILLIIWYSIDKWGVI